MLWLHTHMGVYSRRESVLSKPFQSVKVGGSEKRFDAKAVWGAETWCLTPPPHIGENHYLQRTPFETQPHICSTQGKFTLNFCSSLNLYLKADIIINIYTPSFMFLWGDVSFFRSCEVLYYKAQNKSHPPKSTCTTMLHKSLLRLLTWQVGWGSRGGMKKR